MTIEVAPMSEADIDGAIETIQQAFADDPYSNWVFDKSKFNPTRNHASLHLRCLWGIKHGLFVVAKENGTVLGTAMWLPPATTSSKTANSWSLWWSYWQLWFHQGLMNLRHGRGGLNTRRYWAWKEAQATAQGDIWPAHGFEEAGCYFCNIVTVLPSAQGKGVGRKLMEYVLEKADGEGKWCYLESSRDDPNVKIYNKFGFKLVKKMECKDPVDGVGIALYCMVREPRRVGDATEHGGD